MQITPDKHHGKADDEPDAAPLEVNEWKASSTAQNHELGVESTVPSTDLASLVGGGSGGGGDDDGKDTHGEWSSETPAAPIPFQRDAERAYHHRTAAATGPPYVPANLATSSSSSSPSSSPSPERQAKRGVKWRG